MLLHHPALRCVHLLHFLSAYSEAEEFLPASRVLSSQIPGYDGGEVDTNETVEVMFPLNVRNVHVCHLLCKIFLRCSIKCSVVYIITTKDTRVFLYTVGLVLLSLNFHTNAK